MPIEPLELADRYTDGVGFNALGELNPSCNLSLGLSYEHTAFYSATNFVVETFNFEARTFPFGEWSQNFQPYVLGGIGINAAPDSPGRWDGKYDWIMGLGSRVLVAKPIYLDLVVQNHWMEPSPEYFQYLDVRFGISWSFPDLPEQPTPTPTEVPSPTPTATPASPVIVSPSSAVTVEIETPTKPKLTNEEIMAEFQSGGGSRMKRYYDRGIAAFKKGSYTIAVDNLQKALKIHERSFPSFKYANAYAIIGVINYVHKHKKTALTYFGKALKYDKDNEIAIKYMKKLRPPHRKPKPKPVPRPSENSYQSPVTQNDLNLP